MSNWTEDFHTAGYSATPVFTSAEENKVQSYKHGDILWRIFALESSRGRNGFLYCERAGLRNDFGFNVANKQCFYDLDQELNTVSNWFDHELSKMPLAESLCMYNIGVQTSSCEYAKNFMNL